MAKSVVERATGEKKGTGIIRLIGDAGGELEPSIVRTFEGSYLKEVEGQGIIEVRDNGWAYLTKIGWAYYKNKLKAVDKI